MTLEAISCQQGSLHETTFTTTFITVVELLVSMMYVAVLCRNQSLICCKFWLHHRL